MPPKKEISFAERGRVDDEGAVPMDGADLPVVERICAAEGMKLSSVLCSTGTTAVLRVEVGGKPCKAPLDDGAFSCFVSPNTVEGIQFKVRQLPKHCVFNIAKGDKLHTDHVMKWLTMWCAREHFSTNAFVGPTA